MNYEEFFPLENLPPGTAVAETVSTPIIPRAKVYSYKMPVNRRSQMNRATNRLLAGLGAQQSAVDMEVMRIYGAPLPMDENGKYFIYLEDPQSVETGKKPKVYRSFNLYDFLEKVPAATQRRARAIFTQMQERAIKAEERIAREEMKEYYRQQMAMQRATRKASNNAQKKARVSETRRRRAAWMKAANAGPAAVPAPVPMPAVAGPISRANLRRRWRNLANAAIAPPAAPLPPPAPLSIRNYGIAGIGSRITQKREGVAGLPMRPPIHPATAKQQMNAKLLQRLQQQKQEKRARLLGVAAPGGGAFAAAAAKNPQAAAALASFKGSRRSSAKKFF